TAGFVDASALIGVPALFGAAVLLWPAGRSSRSRLRAARIARSARSAPAPSPAEGPAPASGHSLRPGRLVGRWRRRGRSRTADLSALLALLEGLAGALRAGLSPARAFAHLAHRSHLTHVASTDTVQGHDHQQALL